MTASQDDIRKLATAAEQMAQRLELAKEDAKAAMDAIGAAGLNKQAFKLAMRLKDMDGVKAKSFLDTLDACRDALSIDAQLDLFEAPELSDDEIEAGQRFAAEPASHADESLAAAVGSAIRKARGPARELN